TFAKPKRNIGDEALNATAQAMTAFANAIGRGSKKSLIKIDFYHEKRTQDPVT
ncbi:20570_t:CDS:1, partial [Gigaspora margarita]